MQHTPTHMPTVKLVVIGASGVGKTSFRTQYISGRFSTGYRATIGADFIAKTLPHPSKPDELVTLQIWDTAGQERFSSLSTAFFRGADAALLMFDVNQPETLIGLKTWWEEFRERAPVEDEDLEDYCCVVVGNKTDLVSSRAIDSTSVVSESQALRFIYDLIPPSSPPTTRPSSPVEQGPSTIAEAVSEDATSPQDESDIDDPSFSQSRSQSIDINQYLHRRHPKQLSWGSTTINNGTLTSTHTGVTSYHTPASSLFDAFSSARSSPLPPSVVSRLSSPVRTQRRASASSSTSSAPTITPSLFTRIREQAATDTPPTPTTSSRDLDTSPSHALPLEKGPKLFFTSAKTGEGVHDVFEYIARRVVARWERDEAVDSRTLHVQEQSDTIRLGLTRGESGRRFPGTCC